jgi:hypothetical protein
LFDDYQGVWGYQFHRRNEHCKLDMKDLLKNLEKRLEDL